MNTLPFEGSEESEEELEDSSDEESNGNVFICSNGSPFQIFSNIGNRQRTVSAARRTNQCDTFNNKRKE
jgi:hypothetical protein